jgi:hypothetical protein
MLVHSVLVGIEMGKLTEELRPCCLLLEGWSEKDEGESGMGYVGDGDGV